MQTEQMTIALRKNDGQWEGAVITNGKFQEALVGDDDSNLSTIVADVIVEYIESTSAANNEGTINITFSNGD